MADVYKARCKLLNRFVAIKILKPEFINDEEFLKRFTIELRPLQACHIRTLSPYMT